MRKVLFGLCALFMLVSCNHVPHFAVNGTLTGAEGEVLYLEHTALDATTLIDSCLLDATGAFTMQGEAPAYPDFYRLRLGATYAVLVIDSVETVSLHTSKDSLSLTDAFDGSEQSVLVAQLRRSLREKPMEEHRAFAQQVILSNPRSMAAYYAVFQSKQGEPVFDMYIPQQRKYYQVVATSMDVWMPDYIRTKTLHGQVIDAMNEERKALNALAMRQYIDESEQTILDLALPNIYGDTCLLSEHLGKVTLLEFSSSQMERGNAYILALRELDNKYHKRGLEIFSVSVDPVKLYWEDWVRNLPWTCVRTENVGALRLYNVSAVPTMFLLDKKGLVLGRYTDFDTIDSEIDKQLRK